MTTSVRAVLLLAVVLAPAAASAQSPALIVAYERRHDPFRYRFENASRFDTEALVPHFFEQRYRADTDWLRATARYRAGAVALDTLLAVSAPTVGYGDDVDTFFQPTGDVVTSGTIGDVTLSSWRLRQRVFLPAGRGLGFHMGYALTRDRAEFHASPGFTTHSHPPSREERFVTTRETTWSHVHDVQFGIEPAGGTGAWRLTPRAAAGIGVARLTVRLPDKYPGLDLRFAASIVTADLGLLVQRRFGAVTISGGADYVHTWSLYSHSQFRRRAVSVHGGVGWHGD